MNDVHFRTLTKSIRYKSLARISHIFFYILCINIQRRLVSSFTAERKSRLDGRHGGHALSFIGSTCHEPRVRHILHPIHPSTIAGVFYMHSFKKKENHIISPLALS